MDIGFVGLGNMGNPMAGNLIRAGHRLAVHDLRREAANSLVEQGARWAGTPQEAARGADAVFTSLPGPREVEAVVLGEGGVLAGAGAGATYVDLSTNSPTVIRMIHREGAARGIAVLDAPVSGGVQGAVAATLSVMVGGDAAVFQRVRPLLEVIGKQVFYCGPIGSGSVCKLCNNLASAGNALVLAEALTLGVKAGVALEVLAAVIGASTGSSRRLTERFPRYLFRGDFRPGFAAALAAKDLRLATELGRELGVPMALANLIDQAHVEALGRGWGPEDADALVRLQEERAGVQLRLPGI
ncbi:MAG: NAD(P)-dependent oxidoreductase [Chloroflexi bacterium]|nr:NAD(P)-dependent oxidoreductase [Chloroflexota bacterium]